MNVNGVNVAIRNITDVENEKVEKGEHRKYPNPLFYGDLLNRNYGWNQLYPMDVRMLNAPQRNLALMYLDEPLNISKELSFPKITFNPSFFMNKTVSGQVYGWCQSGEKYQNPSLTKAPIDITSCSTDLAL